MRNEEEIRKALGPYYAVAARYTGVRNGLHPARTLRFEFQNKEHDRFDLVTTGSDWRLTAPIKGVYQVSARISVPIGSFDGYVTCQIAAVRDGETEEKILETSRAYDIVVSASGAFELGRNDQLYVLHGHAGVSPKAGEPEQVTGSFSVHLVGVT